MWLTELSIRRPVMVAMAVLSFVVLGLWAMMRLPIELIPRVDFPFVVVTTLYPGAGPEEVESTVTEKIEEAVSTIPGVRHVMSYSQEGISVVAIQFELGIRSTDAAADVRDKVSMIRAQLPEGVKEPVIDKIDVLAFPVVTIIVSGERPLKDLREFAEDEIAQRLERLPGVSMAQVFGGDVREIQVNVHPEKLDAYRLSLTDVVRALAGAHLNVPAGTLKGELRDLGIRLSGRFQSVQEIRDVPIRFGNRAMGYAGTVVRISDIADVVDTTADRETVIRLNGKEAVGIYVYRHSEANTVEVADAVRRETEHMSRTLPKDIKLMIADDQSVFVRDSLHDLTISMLLGALLAMLVVFVFLRDIKGTIIIGLAIPTSLIAAFIPINFLGYTLNFMVMLGLAHAVGALVDDSIVVLENIYRHLEMGELPTEAAFNGRTEIGFAAIAITLVDVVVFTPMIYMGGIVGRFFRPFAVAHVASVLFSLLVSFTFTPMLASRWFKRVTREELKQEPRNAIESLFAGFDIAWKGVERLYGRALEWALRNRTLTLFIGNASLLTVLGYMAPMDLRVRGVLMALILIIGFLLALFAKGQRGGLIGFAAACAVSLMFIHLPAKFGFIPVMDTGRIFAVIEMPPGTSMKETERAVEMVERELLRMPEVEHVISNIGTTGTAILGAGGYGHEYAMLYIVLTDKSKRERTQAEIAQWLSKWLREQIPAAQISVEEQTGMARRGSPVQVELIGPDRDELIDLAKEVAARMEQIPLLRDVKLGWRPGRPEYHFHIDRQRAADLGFTASDVAWVLRTAIEGNTDLRFKDGDEEYDIRIRLSRNSLNDHNGLLNLIVGTGFKNQPVRVSEVAYPVLSSGPSLLERKDRQKMIAITANLAPGTQLGNAQQAIARAIADIDTGRSRIYFGGDIEMMHENYGYLLSALLLAVVLVYMLQAALFNSTLLPLSIILALPQALIGALLALMLTGKGMSIVAMIGIIMLMGITEKNAILLVDFTNTLRARGLSMHEAMVRAGQVRLRPIAMTTLTLILALIPVALEFGKAGELRSPMAIATIGGLILSWMLTLLVVPVAYTVFEEVAQSISNAWRKLRMAMAAGKD
ncbi:MAG: efflux RND transporter permease subunit [Armatimonadota bacterium]|nr:efflux RND transporter permease subunit [Armatimonadota bacterium]MCX7777318.1 efflux RND transporter permease subunit [Armatimonadota bacterium]MDW8024365.1 efflux RND transporter permease subunit [Armatimonadota bacterium]